MGFKGRVKCQGENDKMLMVYSNVLFIFKICRHWKRMSVEATHTHAQSSVQKGKKKKHGM